LFNLGNAKRAAKARQLRIQAYQKNPEDSCHT
jgi:hypothetical protein